MPKAKKSRKKPIEQYEHKGKKRLNNPPVGLVTPETDKDAGKKKYQFDPHLDPQLVWAGKAERLSFEVDTVSLHVHERIDPRTIIEAVRKKNGIEQPSLFQSPQENPPIRDAIDFYKHKHNWTNRLLAGDSLLVMNSLIEKEGLAGQVQMVYIDPPYGIKYGSNFQPFVNKRDVKDGKDEDLTSEPETIKAFRDTWELGIHSYLAYLRDRLLLAKELLHESGSCFVQISDENVHRVRHVIDEIFGPSNYVSEIIFVRGVAGLGSYISNINDILLWYYKDKTKGKYRPLFTERSEKTLASAYNYVEESNGRIRRLTKDEIEGKQPFTGKRFKSSALVARESTSAGSFDFEFQGQVYSLPPNTHWKTSRDGLRTLAEKGRLNAFGNTLIYKMYYDDFPFVPYSNVWNDVFESTFAIQKYFVVQTPIKVIERCILMTTDPGDIVFDPTCGSGVSAFVAEQWGRRWITCDTSRVAMTLAKQRLMTAVFDYYELAHPDEGVGSGLKYKIVPHITLKSIANNEPTPQETLYDQPFIDNSRTRVSGPFTVEAVPSLAVKSFDEIESPLSGGVPAGRGGFEADESIARSGETVRQAEWRDELFKTGIRGKNGQHILFSRVEPMPGTTWLHADAETKPNELGADKVRDKKNESISSKPQRAVISFGPAHSPLEQRQIALAIEEAQTLVPKPKLIVFASFQFDPEAAKDIDETNWPGVTLLKVQMNTDLLTDDLKKKRASNESFWLIGSPDISLTKLPSGSHDLRGAKRRGNLKDETNTVQYQVEVSGFDYFNTKTGNIESGGKDKIAMWLLDTDYDGRSLFPRQVFFPMSGEKDGWSRLVRNLKAEIDEDLIESYRGTISLPFVPGPNKRIAVKIIDDRGIESLKILEV